MGSAGPTSVGGAPLSSSGTFASNAGGAAAGGLSLASAGLSAYSTMLQAQGTASADEYQAEKLQTAATYGDLKAVQTGGQMTRNINTVLGNIDAVRAASGIDPTSPSAVAVRDQQEGIGNERKTITVNSILQQSIQDRSDAAYYKSAASNALMAGDLSAGAGLVKGLASAAPTIAMMLA